MALEAFTTAKWPKLGMPCQRVPAGTISPFEEVVAFGVQKREKLSTLQ
jgi:hypothetical protein